MAYKVIITGGNGFVGKHLVNELQRTHQTLPEAEIVIWDLPAIDITEPTTYEKSLREVQPDWIVHLAAFSIVGESFKNPELVHRVNVQGTETLLKKIVEISPHTKLLAISSSDIYGIAGSDPIAERPLSEAKPCNPYAESKLAMEKVIEEKFNDRCIRVRPFPHIGPGQGKGFVTSDFAAQIASIEGGKQEPVIKVGNLEARRDFTDVRDVVRAYRLLLEKGSIGEVYNIASGQAVTIQSILDTLLEMSSSHIETERDPDKMRSIDNPVLVGDARKIKTVTNWQPKIALEQSLKDILQYWRSRN